MSSPLRALWRLAAYLLLVAVCLPIQAIGMLLKLPFRRTFPVFFHRMCTRIFGFEIETKGRREMTGPTLFVANHTSYLDIMILGALVDGSFVAKAEVRSWPGFGLLAKLQRTVFVDRRARFAAEQRDEMVRRIQQGDDLILFPEGTSGDGQRVLPFKSALLATAEIQVAGRPLCVQPVTIAYTHLDGMPLGRHLRPLIAWYGEMELGPHVFTMAGLGRIHVVVEFHPPTTVTAVGGRKALARYCEERVGRGLAHALSGARPADAEALPQVAASP